MSRLLVRTLFRAVGSRYKVHRTTRVVHNALTRWATETLDSPVPVRCDLGITVHAIPNEFIGRQLYYTRSWDPHMLTILRALSRRCSVIVDVGANIGFFTLFMAKDSPDAVVHAVEPQSDLADLIERSARASGISSIHVHRCALSSCERNGVLQIDHKNRGRSCLADKGEGEARTVRLLDATRFLEELSLTHVDLLKLDIEGHEDSVLASLDRWIIEHRISVIVLESRGKDTADAAAPLLKNGYNVFGLQKQLFRPAVIPTHGADRYEDLIAVRPENVDEVSARLRPWISIRCRRHSARHERAR